MKNPIRLVACLLVVAASIPAHAALKVLATTPDWGALTQELGGDKVNVYVATTALQDVHRVEAKPSLVARARSADLLVATGAELEIGWLPVLIQESGNTKIQTGQPGYFEAASVVPLRWNPLTNRTDGGLAGFAADTGTSSARDASRTKARTSSPRVGSSTSCSSENRGREGAFTI